AEDVVVHLRMLAEWRVDQELHFAVQDGVEAIRTAFVNLQNWRHRDSPTAQILRSAGCRKDLEAHLLKPARDRRHVWFVVVVDRDENAALQRQAIARGELRLGKTPAERLGDSHDFASG